MFETQVALLSNVALSWLNLGQEAERWGTQHPSVVPYDAFKTKDLYFVCGATNDKQFQNLCTVLGQPLLAEDTRFRTNADRVANRDELFPILSDLFARKTTQEWLVAFEGSGMPYAPINTMEKVFAHPQTEAREMVETIPFEPAVSGSIKILGKISLARNVYPVHLRLTFNAGPAVKFSETKATIRSKPPLLGEHTIEILKEIGLEIDEIDELNRLKVVGVSARSELQPVE